MDSYSKVHEHRSWKETRAENLLEIAYVAVVDSYDPSVSAYVRNWDWPSRISIRDCLMNYTGNSLIANCSSSEAYCSAEAPCWTWAFWDPHSDREARLSSSYYSKASMVTRDCCCSDWNSVSRNVVTQPAHSAVYGAKVDPENDGSGSWNRAEVAVAVQTREDSNYCSAWTSNVLTESLVHLCMRRKRMALVGLHCFRFLIGKLDSDVW